MRDRLSGPIRRGRRGGFASAAFLATALGCASESPETPEVQNNQFEGLSREQIEQQAEQMTPEEAERLGIVDTTIKIEPPVNPDSVIE